MNNIIFIVSVSIALAVILFVIFFLLIQKHSKLKIKTKEKKNDLLEIKKTADKSVQQTRERNINHINGLGGWLVWVQIRLIIIGLLIAGTAYFIQGTPLYFGLISIVSYVVCLLSFYNVKKIFKITYMVNTAISIVYVVFVYLYDPTQLWLCAGALGALLVLDGMIIPTLFRSVRVNNTFATA